MAKKDGKSLEAEDLGLVLMLALLPLLTGEEKKEEGREKDGGDSGSLRKCGTEDGKEVTRSRE